MKDAQNIKELFMAKITQDALVLRNELEQLQFDIDVLNARYKRKNQQLVRLNTILEESSKMEDEQ
jgi:hypothetical protein